MDPQALALIPDLDFSKYLTDNNIPSAFNRINVKLLFSEVGLKQSSIFRLARWNPEIIKNYFDWENYLLLNPELLKKGLVNRERILQHFMSQGPKGLAVARFRKSPPLLERMKSVFDTDFYSETYPDLRHLKGEALWDHFVRYGINENRNFRLRTPLDCLEVVLHCLDIGHYTTSNPEAKGLYYRSFLVIHHFITQGGWKKNYQFNGLNRHLADNRQTVFLGPSEKVCFVDLNEDVTSGLMNQIFSLLNCVLLAKASGRRIIITGFYPDYCRPTLTSIDQVIDLGCLNRVAGVTIRGGVLDPEARRLEYPISNSTLDGLIKGVVSATENRVVYVPNIFSTLTFRAYNPHDFAFIKALIPQLRFSPELVREAEAIKKELGIHGPYNAVHLRLEDDLALLKTRPNLSDEQWFETKYQEYDRKLSQFDKNRPIYVCSGLKKYNNKYNHYLDQLQAKYPTMTYRKNYSSTRGREIEAALDFIICTGATNFLGYAVSTFSIVASQFPNIKTEMVSST